MQRLKIVATSGAALAVVALAASVSLAATPRPSATPSQPPERSGPSAAKPPEAEHPEIRGTVTSVAPGRIVITTKDASTTTVLTTATTAYVFDGPGTSGETTTSAAIHVGAAIEAEGTASSDGTYAATKIELHPPRFDGTVTSVNGSNLVITRADGTTATVVLGSATTFHGEDGASASAADVAVGMEIHARGSLNANGSLAATAVDVKHPEIHGTVTSVAPGRIVVARKGGASTAVLTTAATTYVFDGPGASGAAPTSSDVRVGADIEAEGAASSDGTFAATKIELHPPRFDGTVTAVNGSRLTIARPDGTSATIVLGSATAFHGEPGRSASAADVTVGVHVDAHGSLNADGTLTSVEVHIGGPRGK